jgi:diguanylate cyclase (GGDEF)-like protein/PAS domain S-box-containing protein
MTPAMLIKENLSHVSSCFSLPEDMLNKVRWLFMILSLAGCLPVLLTLVFIHDLQWFLRVGTVAGLLWFCWVRVREYQGKHLPILWNVTEGVALIFICMVVSPVEALSILYIGLFARSLQGSSENASTAWLIYSLSLLTASAIAPSKFTPPTLGFILNHLLGFAFGAYGMLSLTKFLLKHQRALTREQVLIRAGAALVANPHRESIYASAIEATLYLTEELDNSRTFLAIGPIDNMILVATAGDWSDMVKGNNINTYDLPDDIQNLLREKQPAAINYDSSSELNKVFGLDERGGSCFITPLLIRSELRGLIVVDSSSAIPRECQDGLMALAAQVALALESAALTEDLSQNEARFRSLVQNSSDIIMIVEKDGTIRYQTPSVKGILGYTLSDLSGMKLSELLHPNDAQQAASFLTETTNRSRLTLPVEWRLKHKDGRWVPVEAISNNLLHDEYIRGIVISIRNISDRKTLEAQLTHQAFHDPLSELPNRLLFTDKLRQALIAAEKGGNELAVMFLDLDNFKVINDSLGHQVGDQLLVTVAQRLQACLRPGDMVARLGGDEFTILLEHISSVNDATAVAERIQAQLQVPVKIQGYEVFTSASIGIVLRSPMHTSPESLLRDADVAMYCAKNKGKAQYEIFNSDMSRWAVKRLELETDLRRAIERGEFKLYYQPIITLDDYTIREVEALVRWQHPQRGTISPEEFIPLAEENRMILSFGQWVLWESCRQAKEWQLQYPSVSPLVISVNISGRQLQNPRLVEDVAQILNVTGLEPSCLKLEITESVAMHDAESTIATLRQLKKLGVQLAIDDFGTGYSSLGYLKRFPLDTLKIDRSFVERLGVDSEDTAIVNTIITLAKTLNLHVTGEGIETAEQLSHLRTLGCDLGQGYFFSKPLPGEALTALMSTLSLVNEPSLDDLLSSALDSTVLHTSNITIDEATFH